MIFHVFQAQNGHDVVCSTLLEHGADVTIVDELGKTPLDITKSKKVKATIKAAWTEAMQKKITSQLAPIDLRRSGSFTQGLLQGQGEGQSQSQSQGQSQQQSTSKQQRSVDEIYEVSRIHSTF